MKLKYTLLLLLIFLLSACQGISADLLQQGRTVLDNLGGKPLGEQEIAAGLKEALQVGSERTVAQLGRAGGFNLDPAIRLTLPESLLPVQRALSGIGAGHYLQELELQMNRAAEQAVPLAMPLFRDAISQLSWHDVKAIYQGPEDAATRYFSDRMTPALQQRLQPLVAQTLNELGVVRLYEQTLNRYRMIPLAPEVKFDLNSYVTERAIGGMFHHLAREEAAIRQDPAKRTTALLKRVFGAN